MSQIVVLPAHCIAKPDTRVLEKRPEIQVRSFIQPILFSQMMRPPPSQFGHWEGDLIAV